MLKIISQSLRGSQRCSKLNNEFFISNQLGVVGRRQNACSGNVTTLLLHSNRYHTIGNPLHEYQPTVTKATNFIPRDIGQPSPWTHPHLLNPNDVTPEITKLEYKTRRENLCRKLRESGSSDRCLAIIAGNATQYMTNDIPYPFYQNTDFFYLCGFLEPESLLVIDVDSGATTLFVPNRDKTQELWHGPRAGVDGARELLGVQDCRAVNHLEDFFRGQNRNDEFPEVWTNVKPSSSGGMASAVNYFITSTKKEAKNIKEKIAELRVLKSQNEIKVLQRASDITSRAFIETMRECKPGVEEREIYATIDYHCRTLGGECLAYPPVVAGGTRATTLHYIVNNQRVAPTELVLLDAGCMYGGYVADITRTWNVSGRFSDAQSLVYNMVESVQSACLSVCGPGVSLNEINLAMQSVLADSLSDSRLLSGTDSHLESLALRYCPHHVGHYLGLDVHDTDTVSRTRPLQPGMVITVEPGLYFRDSDTSVVADVRGIGIRIEDNVLITETGATVLSKNCPKDLLSLEEIIGTNIR